MELQLSDMCYKAMFIKKLGRYVPCGRCPKCIARRVSSWSFRLLQEEKVCTSAHFLTLTYDTRHVPILPSGGLSLCKRDLQLFFKRLRKSQCGSLLSPIKYYAVGEYGGKTERPHYHVILFNAELELIGPAWNLGDIHYGKVEGASIGYTLKYMCKQKKNSPGRSPGDPRVREFAVMSKGLGISYLTDTMLTWHTDDIINRMYCTVDGGIKISMPRYYKDKMYFELEKAAIADAYAIISNEKQLLKMAKQSFNDVRNEQRAIDASFDRMYKKSLKTLV